MRIFYKILGYTLRISAIILSFMSVLIVFKGLTGLYLYDNGYDNSSSSITFFVFIVIFMIMLLLSACWFIHRLGIKILHYADKINDRKNETLEKSNGNNDTFDQNGL
jgi:hypothetical protein